MPLQVKNKALQQSSSSNRWLYSQVMFTYLEVIAMINKMVKEQKNTSSNPRAKEFPRALLRLCDLCTLYG